MTKESQWQAKDYADGWIAFPNKEEALKYQEETGALVRYIQYFPAHNHPVNKT